MDVFEVVHIPEREKVTAIVVEHQLEIHSVYIKSMDLNSSLPKDTKIYVRPSIGVDTTLGKCWRLKKAVFGLKQAAFEWFNPYHKKVVVVGILSCEN